MGAWSWTVIAVALTMACKTDAPSTADADAAFDERCVWPYSSGGQYNGPGFCDGNTHVRCDDLDRVVQRTECSPHGCIDAWKTSKVHYAGCAIGPPLDPACPSDAASTGWNVSCDETGAYICVNEQRGVLNGPLDGRGRPDDDDPFGADPVRSCGLGPLRVQVR